MTKSRAWEALIGEASRVVWCDQCVAVPAGCLFSERDHTMTRKD
jgi:hypothetical protein